MRHIKLFESFNKKLTDTQIEYLNKVVSGTWKQNAKDEIDVTGDVTLYDIRDIKLPFVKDIKFGKIIGSFWCGNNDLISLKDCAPYYVEDEFSCVSNNLSSLEYGPKYVGGK